MIVPLVALSAIFTAGCTIYIAIMRAAKKPYQPVDLFGSSYLSKPEVLGVSRFDIIDIGM